MITAKNYVAQVVETALKICKEGGEQRQRDNEFYKSLVSALIKAQHFVLPDDGILFDDDFKGLLDKKLRLPFQIITVEYFITPRPYFPGGKVVVLATQEDEDTAIRITGFLNVEGNWRANLFSVVVHSDWQGSDGTEPLTNSFLGGGKFFIAEGFEVNFPDLKRYLEERCGSDNVKVGNLNKVGRELAASMATPIFELLEALSCKNVTTVTYQKEAANNQQKMKRGKLPIYETKLLVIKPVDKNHNKANRTGATHSPPRQHLRRGHIRRLGSGNIWVNSCVVGSSKKGNIEKIYELRK